MNERVKVLKVVNVVKIVKRVYLKRVTFEHRHGSKSCSACQERVNECVKVFLVLSFGQTIMEIGDWRFASLLICLVYFQVSQYQ